MSSRRCGGGDENKRVCVPRAGVFFESARGRPRQAGVEFVEAREFEFEVEMALLGLQLGKVNGDSCLLHTPAIAPHRTT